MTRQEAIDRLREDIDAYILCGKEEDATKPLIEYWKYWTKR